MEGRYFIAIRLPDDISSIIETAQKELLPGYSVMQPFQPHITLLPPNVLDGLPPESITANIKASAESYFPIPIELVRTGVFEKRVLHIEILSPKMIKLQKELMDLLPTENRAKSDRQFMPHITLAQAKPKQDLPDELIEKLKERINPYLPQRFKAVSISKFKWLRPRTYQDEAV
jgi:2'-5' RNA ligase